jgi:PTH1 family peptidyl-tRNA hydrolase
MIRLFVGLGNPGAQYEATRHNAGFWWIDAAARALGASLAAEPGWFGVAARVNRPRPGIDGPIWLLEPMTYMNLSGKSVAALARFYKIAPAEMLVVHDELDLEPGQCKLKLGGSAAGHNGLKDIHAQMGTLDFWRLRLGIGHPGVKSEVVGYVLQKPSTDHRIAIDQAIDRSVKALDLLLAGQMERAMTAVPASKPQRPKPPRRMADPASAEDSGPTDPHPNPLPPQQPTAAPSAPGEGAKG